MQKVMPYKDLNHALKLFRGQVSESIPYAIENLPKFNTPEEAFNWLKLHTHYKKDPKGRELFQTLPTLLDDNWHGITGHGDCDCFTIAALATLIANGFTDVGIVLVGRNPLIPVHIYAYVMNNGKREYFDLTNKIYNYERFYPYKQHIQYKLNQNEKNMILELAEDFFTANARKSQRPQTMQYVHLPNQRIQVREDYFDGMSAGEFQTMCLSEGVEPHTIVELSSRRSERKAARAAGELRPGQKRRLNKKAQKNVINAAKPKNVRKLIKQESKAELRRDKGQTKLNKSLQPKQATNWQDVVQAAIPQAYNNPDENEEIIEVEAEEVTSPEEQYEEQMEELFMGESEIAGITVKHPILWALGLTIAGAALGYALENKLHKKNLKAA